jgi:hypothetical protein
MKIWETISDYKYKVFNHHWWRNFYYEQISSRLNPRNKWLTKQIPRTWVDKDHILEICVLGALVDYVEGEKCFEVLNTEGPPHQVAFLREVMDNYEIVKYQLPALKKKLDYEWDHIPIRGWKDINKGTKEDYDRTYGRIDDLEKQIYDLQTKVMTWIVVHRDGLWT